MPKQQFLFPAAKIESYKIKKIIKRNGLIVPFNRERILNSILKAALAVGGGDKELAGELADDVIKMMGELYPSGSTPSVEEISDLTERVLVEGGYFRTAKAYILYRHEHSKLREGKESSIRIEDNVPYKNLLKVFSWNVDHNCETVKKLNKKVNSAKFKTLIRDCEKLYKDEVNAVAQKIIKNKNKIRIAIVAGPSSSGKTTTTIKIGEILQKEGVTFSLMNLDNYFKNLNEHPKDEYGDYDFETPYALDLPLINEHLDRLLEGKTIKSPKYDFKTGKRTLNAAEFSLKPGQILLIDSLHGLYDELTLNISQEFKFKLYIEAMCQLKYESGEFVRWADLRMLRRMARDSWHRGYDPGKTVGHWHYVRRSEMKYIVPFIGKVDHVFNSALAYELPVYKKYLFKYFPVIIREYETDQKKVDAFIRAKRVYELLMQVDELKDDYIIPRNSLLREFIGGSSYKY
ncbi:MAG: hypothetical protein A3J83_00050 [Elusimicrobia bacterium RIFOXYA2_FULL_40_6]|nr:MAG: hypothetical protein A3J83_00050 [Elusimicrobia bacterium RIFOXYA2_FULL_40_6]